MLANIQNKKIGEMGNLLKLECQTKKYSDSKMLLKNNSLYTEITIRRRTQLQIPRRFN